jgi:hypothetical protein
MNMAELGTPRRAADTHGATRKRKREKEGKSFNHDIRAKDPHLDTSINADCVSLRVIEIRSTN